LWSYAFVDDVAGAHVAALAHPSPAREYILGGVNAPQGAIFDFLKRKRGRTLPLRIPYGVATAAAFVEEARAALTKRPPLLTRGIVHIFRHDWPLESDVAIAALGLHITALEDGLERTLTSMS
jgi:nucleoside-diphosphate-sugar epimerase